VHQHDMRQRNGERSKDDNAYVQRRMWQCRTDSWAIAVVNESGFAFGPNDRLINRSKEIAIDQCCGV
jgi:hypothetical protein